MSRLNWAQLSTTPLALRSAKRCNFTIWRIPNHDLIRANEVCRFQRFVIPANSTDELVRRNPLAGDDLLVLGPDLLDITLAEPQFLGHEAAGRQGHIGIITAIGQCVFGESTLVTD